MSSGVILLAKNHGMRDVLTAHSYSEVGRTLCLFLIVRRLDGL